MSYEITNEVFIYTVLIKLKQNIEKLILKKDQTTEEVKEKEQIKKNLLNGIEQITNNMRNKELKEIYFNISLLIVKEDYTSVLNIINNLKINHQ